MGHLLKYLIRKYVSISFIRDKYNNADGLEKEGTMLHNNNIELLRYILPSKKLQAAYNVAVFNSEKQLKCLKIGVYFLVNSFLSVCFTQIILDDIHTCIRVLAYYWL